MKWWPGKGRADNLTAELLLERAASVGKAFLAYAIENRLEAPKGRPLVADPCSQTNTAQRVGFRLVAASYSLRTDMKSAVFRIFRESQMEVVRQQDLAGLKRMHQALFNGLQKNNPDALGTGQAFTLTEDLLESVEEMVEDEIESADKFVDSTISALRYGSPAPLDLLFEDLVGVFGPKADLAQLELRYGPILRRLFSDVLRSESAREFVPLVVPRIIPTDDLPAHSTSMTAGSVRVPSDVVFLTGGLSGWLKRSISQEMVDEVASDTGYDTAPFFWADEAKARILWNLLMANTALLVFAINRVLKSERRNDVVIELLGVASKIAARLQRKHPTLKLPDVSEYRDAFSAQWGLQNFSRVFLRHLRLLTSQQRVLRINKRFDLTLAVLLLLVEQLESEFLKPLSTTQPVRRSNATQGKTGAPPDVRAKQDEGASAKTYAPWSSRYFKERIEHEHSLLKAPTIFVTEGYEVVEKHAGGMGEVLISRTSDGRLVALKRTKTTTDVAAAQQMADEATILFGLSYSYHLLPEEVLPANQRDTCTIVLPFCAGASLADRAKFGTLSWPEVVHYAMVLTAELQDLHDAGILHLDLKPANVLFDRAKTPNAFVSWRVLLSDYGLSVLKHSRETLESRGGTLAFMAPEQMEHGRVVDSRTDLWGLGATLYSVLAGTGLDPVWWTLSEASKGVQWKQTRSSRRPDVPDAGSATNSRLARSRWYSGKAKASRKWPRTSTWWSQRLASGLSKPELTRERATEAR